MYVIGEDFVCVIRRSHCVCYKGESFCMLWLAVVAEGNGSRDDILNVAATGSTERKSVASAISIPKFHPYSKLTSFRIN